MRRKTRGCPLTQELAGHGLDLTPSLFAMLRNDSSILLLTSSRVTVKGVFSAPLSPRTQGQGDDT